MVELTDHTASELGRMLVSRTVSATEVMQAYLARIASLNPHLNAIVTLDPERALALARQADGHAGSDPARILHGLPIAIKDLVDVAGMRTTLGSPVYRDRVPEADAPIVRRLREAGAIVIGKTNTPEFGAGSQTFNPVFGATRNPYDLARTAGGSSGGAAAAVAARMIPFADGSDLGGSLRNPASFCNVVGFRPSGSLGSQADGSDLWDPMSVSGPIARTVTDAALLLQAIAAPDRHAPLRVGRPPGSVPSIPLKRLRIAWSPNLTDLPIDESVASALEAKLTDLESHGCKIEPDQPDLAGADETFHTLRALAFVRDRLEEVTANPGLVKDTVVWNLEEGLALDPVRIARAQRRRSEIFRSVAAFLERYDAFALPAAAVPPFPVEVEWVREIDGVPCETYLDWMRVCTRISVTAHPAISIPFAFTESGLPVGLQLVGRHGEDDGLLGVAAAIEDATDASRRQPALAEIRL